MLRFRLGQDSLESVRSWVGLNIWNGADDLLEEVALEIWQLDDGVITEEELRSRLVAILGENGAGSVSFGVDKPERSIREM